VNPEPSTRPGRRLVAGFAAGLLAALLLPALAAASGPPVLATPAATNVQGISALLSGEVSPQELDTTSRFEYVNQQTFEEDQPNGYAHAIRTAPTEIDGGASFRSVTASLSGLTPETTYHFRLVAENSAGSEQSADQTFTTFAGFGFLPGHEGFDAVALNEDGSVDNRASSHPYVLSTEFNFNLAGESGGEPGVPVSDGDLKDLRVDLPSGLIENPTAVPQCSQTAFQTPRVAPLGSHSGESCPDRTQIGVVEFRSSFGGGSTRTFGVYNLEPPPGAPSELGFNPYGAAVTFVPHVRETGTEYGLTLESRNFSQQLDVYGFKLTLWGSPWNVTHSAERGSCLNENLPSAPLGKCPIGEVTQKEPTAYLTLPSTCAAPMTWTASATSWQQPDTVTHKFFSHFNQGPPMFLSGCQAIVFEPKPSARLVSPRASSPSGLDFNIDVDELGLLRPKRLAPSQVKTAVVQLPPGVTINPSVGAGLGYCSRAQYAAETFSSPPGAACPNDSKIGDFKVLTPLVDEPISGGLFLAKPHDNPFDSLFGIYLIAKAPERGILVKVAGRLTPDETTGQLTATFENLPQIPYTHLEVHFREGQRSPLATPPACGSFTIGMGLSPWLEPARVVPASSPLTIDSGIGGGPCPEGTPPFAPYAEAGSVNSNAGAYTPFYVHLTRQDTEQEITSYSISLPPGLTGKLGRIPYCSDAAIEAAKKRGGFEEAENPSCPAESKIGRTVAGYGLGSVLAYAPGGLYLAGPFHGSPFSIVAIDSATVGPFDLGVVVIRSAIKVDPQTAQVGIDSAGSDPIPHIIDGIPIHLRDVRVYISRPGLTLNPTSCAKFSVDSTMSGSGLSFGDPGDDSKAVASSPYQVSNCGALGFKPTLSLRLKGGTERGIYPSLRAEVRPRPGDANIGAATVALPPSEFLAQNHIRGICTRPQFARDACPAGSVYGSVRAFTPLLSQPLEGKVYLRASNNPLPDLVATLRGGGNDISIDVVGRIDSVRGGLRAIFKNLPDAPVSKFVMTLNGGKQGLLVNSEDICLAKRPANARFIGQNNVVAQLHPRLVNSKCGGQGKQSASKRSRRER
jgi:hypothetical protein